MKHVLTSAGMLALGAVALHATDPQLTRQNTGRPWSLSATVRGFYDDNITTSPDKVVSYPINPSTGLPVQTVTGKEGSYGVQVAPSVSLNLPLEQTFISLGYTYSLMWYENREPKNIDQSHLFTGELTHQFSPRHTIGVRDTFIFSSEPTVVEQDGIITSPIRTEGNVMHNIGGIEDTFQLTPTVGLNFAYDNNWYDYEQEGQGSRSALLDRMEHLIHGDVRYGFTPTLIGLVGYAYGIYSYSGDELIAPGYMSDDRNNTSQYGYLGADYDLTGRLRTSVRLGAQYTDYEDNASDSVVNPFADASLTYVYMPQSSVRLGVRHARNATDVSTLDPVTGLPTLDQITTAVYGKLTHQITSHLSGSLIGQYQFSTFNQGLYGDDSETMWLAGLNLEYVFNHHWAADIGYDYDVLNSDIPNREYSRNRVYIGVRLTY
jgi:Putative beta-barrel porin 2